MIDRRRRDVMFRGLGAVGALALAGPSRLVHAVSTEATSATICREERRAMAEAALRIASQRIRGGPHDPAYPKPFVDAAFSSNIFYWDTCFIACYAKYHQDALPIANALDNFYARMDGDGHICREYLADGSPMWPKSHPVSVNPPLLAFAELELQSVRPDRARLETVYPLLSRHFEYLHRTYRMDDGLFFGDAFGSGMDNIPRHPDGWQDDGQGIPLQPLHPEIFAYEGLAPRWNRQGRSVDFSAQMALFAEQMGIIARAIGRDADLRRWRTRRRAIAEAINRACWSEEDGCYYDLGYGQRIRRQHIGMFWTLMAGVAPRARARRLIGHLTDPAKFWRKVPVASYPADQPGYSPAGDYWLGSVWAPTNTMVVRGLARYGRDDLARELVRRYCAAVAAVFRSDGTFYENYAPDAWRPGAPARPEFCGWSAILPLALSREWLGDEET